jgi:hypothetical protein
VSVRVKLLQPVGEFESAHLRHLNDCDQNLRPVLSDGLEELFPSEKDRSSSISGSIDRSAGSAPRNMLWSSASATLYLFRQRVSTSPTNREADCSADSLSSGKVISSLVLSPVEAVHFVARPWIQPSLACHAGHCPHESAVPLTMDKTPADLGGMTKTLSEQ